MRLRPPLLVSVTRHEDKEHKLQEFICQHLNGFEHGGGTHLTNHLLIVARSLTSPLVRAVVGLTHEIAASGRSARMILAHIEGEPQLEDWGRSVTFSHEIRWAKHPRLIEAHEQLVLGPQTCWIGDCMRRDPAKCDAYESYVEGCGEAAGCATVSFERLWLACQPLVSRTARRVVGIAAGSPLPTVEAAPQATAGTRH
jgi:hypothetical protein